MLEGRKMLSLRLVSGKPLLLSFTEKSLFFCPRIVSHGISRNRKICSGYTYSFHRNVSGTSAVSPFQTRLPFASDSTPEDSPLSEVEDVLVSYVIGKKKVTEVAHKVWEHVVRKGDTVVDATCGNGYDTLTLLKMVADESQQGRVYGLDVQKAALESTSSLLEQSVSSNEKELVKLFQKCHSKMAEVLPADTLVRLVAFNLGYLPGGDKTVITEPQTTLEALKVARDVLMPGGLISLVVYVGHPGGRQELETVQEFSSELSVEKWTCCKLQMMNRPLSPISHTNTIILQFIQTYAKPVSSENYQSFACLQQET